jgi:hypothetical protein
VGSSGSCAGSQARAARIPLRIACSEGPWDPQDRTLDSTLDSTQDLRILRAPLKKSATWDPGILVLAAPARFLGPQPVCLENLALLSLQLRLEWPEIALVRLVTGFLDHAADFLRARVGSKGSHL